MIREVAHITVLPDHKDQFETALRTAVDDVLSQANGMLAFTGVGWCVERPNVYLFTIDWESLEAHTIGFRESELFTEWRALIGSHFDGAPIVEHFVLN